MLRGIHRYIFDVFCQEKKIYIDFNLSLSKAFADSVLWRHTRNKNTTRKLRNELLPLNFFFRQPEMLTRRNVSYQKKIYEENKFIEA